MLFSTKDKLDENKIVHISVAYENTIFKPINHFFVLSLICEGNLAIKINDEIINIQAPALICLDNRKKIEILSSNALYVKTIYFDPIFINKNMTVEALHSETYSELVEIHSYFQLSPFLEHNENYNSVIKLEQNICDKISELVDLCKEQIEEQYDWYWSCRTRSYYMEILQLIERIYFNFNIIKTVPTKKNNKDEQLINILNFINLNFDKNITLNLICSKFNVNRTKVEEIFKNNLNTTYYKYIQEQRLVKMCSMLRFTSLTLVEIAFRCGFSTSQNLCKFFKAKMNFSPDKFRKNEVNNRIANKK